jgi:hypothetical protein
VNLLLFSVHKSLSLSFFLTVCYIMVFFLPPWETQERLGRTTMIIVSCTELATHQVCTMIPCEREFPLWKDKRTDGS